jgi:virginiamycin B lyase
MPHLGEIEIFTPAEGIEMVAPSGVIRGPDDRIWFTAIGNDRLGRVDPNTGLIDVYADPAGALHLPANVYPGPDDRIWFTSLGSDRVGRIDPAARNPSHTIETFTAPGLSQPVAIKLAADGRIWFSLRGADALASIDPLAGDPAATIEIVRGQGIGAPAAIFPAADGCLWWVNSDVRTIARLDPRADAPASTIERIAGAPVIAEARAWAADAAGRIWLTVREKNTLVRIEPTAPASGPRRHARDRGLFADRRPGRRMARGGRRNLVCEYRAQLNRAPGSGGRRSG